ncbi:MAG: hypothetical protein K1X57_21845 [Gemmataceae bacterium]|nr:hypothetical protein [Gemmataceae bacterium]
MPKHLGCLATLLTAIALAPPALAAPPNTPTTHTRLPAMSIPFTAVSGSRVRDVELYASTDQGKTWTYVQQAVPSQRREENKFRYVAPNDGEYWFAVRSIDANGAGSPPTLDQLQAGLVVYLDRRAPLVQLRAATPGKPNQVGVEWDVREENFDPSRFKLEYRVPGGQDDWAVQPTDAKVSGTQLWELTTAPKLEVRLRCGDRAGNQSEATILLTPGSASSAVSSTGSEPNGNAGASSNGAPAGNRPAVHYINSTQVAIPFRVSNVGVSGVPVMDLWYTRDNGRSWQKVPRQGDDTGTLPATPGDGDGVVKQFTFPAPGEGLYGFTVVVRSGVGIGDPDPRTGDAPKQMVEVDVTRPEVHATVTRGAGAEVRNVTIEWSAKDKNLADKPVSLHYSTNKDGPWETIISDLDARGRYVWSVSDQGPFQFFVQVRAKDKAENVGASTWNDRITVDLSRPQADLLEPKPASK